MYAIRSYYVPLPFIDFRERDAMLALARQTLAAHWHPEAAPKPPTLAHGELPLGCFVTLHEHGALRVITSYSIHYTKLYEDCLIRSAREYSSSVRQPDCTNHLPREFSFSASAVGRDSGAWDIV